MALTIRDRVVVFDYGEVISHSPSERDRADLLAVAGVSDEAFWPPYWEHRDGLDQGRTSIRDYWRLVASDLGVEWSEATIHELWVADFTGWLSVNPATFEVIADLHDGGTRVALLSNAGFDFASPFRFSPMARFFERMFISAELSTIKPNPEIYLEVARELGITPQQMVFIDNKQVNVDGAEALGITGHHFIGAAELRTFLESLSVR
ncbi:HAD family hydrolase [Lacisediminihabitans profunda]|uniref:HAD family phosphatase n=1 Tax=Lacisediminihabitans profunda TaxID=2594790 RepID=A0A5C8US38_9MICO|nr:HAD family phosphatase [Lacisediminihabitans profunda]TXN31335.1 HAD family phosphatase [Lacisediminihabitans profunda]